MKPDTAAPAITSESLKVFAMKVLGLNSLYLHFLKEEIQMTSKIDLKKLTLAGMFLALCLALPFLTGQIPQIGSALAPMHIPVLLCGFVCGAPYGLAVGFIAPLLRFALFSMPPIMPTGIAMAFELATYGLMTGLMYKRLPQKNTYIYITLVSSMLMGRVVWGLARFLIAGLQNTNFTFEMFLAGAFINAVPGIICHIVLIPFIVMALRKAKLMANE
jgi:riboflavin transporter FmnP